MTGTQPPLISHDSTNDGKIALDAARLTGWMACYYPAETCAVLEYLVYILRIVRKDLGLLRLLIFLDLQLCIDYIIRLREPGDIPRHTHAAGLIGCSQM